MELSYYTIKQAAEKLQLSERTIRRKIKSKDIPIADFPVNKILIPAWFFKKGEIEGGQTNVDFGRNQAS